MPPASPAATMLQYRSSNAFGCLRSASASVDPDSTSWRIWYRTFWKRPVLLLVAQDLEALDQRETGVDHHRELPGEDRDLLAADAAAQLRKGELLPLLRDGGDDDLLPAERGDDRVLVLGDQHAFLRPCRRGSRPFHV